MLTAHKIDCITDYTRFNVQVNRTDVFLSFFSHTDVLLAIIDIKTRVVIDFKHPCLKLAVDQYVKSVNLENF
jgi:hypothetical protein